MSTRPARHRRPEPPDGPAAALLARLGAVPAERATDVGASTGPVPGWVPQRPALDTGTSCRRPRAWPAVRWSAARRAVLGVAAVLAVAVLVALLLVWRAQPSAEAAPAVHRNLPVSSAGTGVTPTVATGAATAAASPAAEVVVHVVGAVHHPGLVRLPAGSRVVDAVRAAGGTTASARPASVNLARLLVDGEQLVVQRRGSTPLVAAPGPAGAVGSAGATPAPSAPVDLNSATLEALDALPGIGPVLAQRILDWRTAHGRFSSVDELGEVSGIGEATLADLRPVVTV